jgi:hypothetical protein
MAPALAPDPGPGWRPVAFKEWQLVADAIADGQQSVLLRKGGISEGKAGFQWLHPRFFLFPSRFHEQAAQVLPDAAGEPRRYSELPGLGEDEVPFSIYVETLATGRLLAWDEVQSLAPYHIWTEAIVRERFEWGDEPGLAWAAIRAWRLPRPWILKDRATFGGCRSWFGLPPDEGGDWRSLLAEAQPVVPRCGWPPFPAPDLGPAPIEAGPA